MTTCHSLCSPFGFETKKTSLLSFAASQRDCYQLEMTKWRTLLALSSLLGSSPAFAGPPPDWVKNGGQTPRFPPRTYMVGFAVVDRENELDSAKAQSAADLAARISVRIESQVSDVQSEKDGQQKYAVAALTKASTDVRLSGLAYETYVGEGKTYALAVISRESGAAGYLKTRTEAARAAQDKLASGEKAETEKRESDALKLYLQVRPLVAEALESDAIVRVLTGQVDEKLSAELGSAMSAADERVTKLLRRPVSSLRDAAQVLSLQVAQQNVTSSDRRTVAPLTYGTTTFSSGFGRQFASDFEAALVPALSAGTAGRDLTLRGTYAERGDAVRIVIMVNEAQTGKVIASAETEIAKSLIPKDLPLLPQNFAQALKEQRVLAAGEEVSGSLRLELWTNKGRSNLVYRDKEEMKVFMRVNKPAYVRLVYVLAKQNAGGEQLKVPLTQSYYIDATKVNLAVEYPEAFEVSAPFGVEHIQAVAFTDKPEPLPTRKMVVDGEEYEVVGSAELVKHRGVKVKKAEAQTSEALVSITTTR